MSTTVYTSTNIPQANPSNITATRDTNNILFNYDLSGVSIYNEAAGFPYNSKAILVSNKHVLFAAHTMGFPYPTNFKVAFVNNSNTVFVYTVTSTDIAYSDIMIGVLSTTVDASLKIYKVLPSDFNDYIETSLDINSGNNILPTFYFTQTNNNNTVNKVCVGDAQNVFQVKVSYDATRQSYAEYVVPGESGNPIFTVIGNELVLLGEWFTGNKSSKDPVVAGDTIGAFPALNYSISSINSLMTSLAGSSYSLTQINLSAYKDFGSPNIPTLNITSPTYDRTPEMSGMGTLSSTITIYDGVTSIGTTNVSSTSTSWNFTPGTDLSISTHTITAKSTLSGTTSEASSPVTLVVQSVPTPTITTSGNTYNPYQTIQGTCVSGITNTITVYDGGVSIGTVSSNTSGAWSFTPASPLDNGSHTITTTATISGNISATSSPSTITVQIPDPPTLSFTSPTTDTTPTVTGTAIYPAQILVYIDDVFAAPVATSDSGGNFSWTPSSALSVASHTIKARQRFYSTPGPLVGTFSSYSTPQTLEITT